MTCQATSALSDKPREVKRTKDVMLKSGIILQRRAPEYGAGLPYIATDCVFLIYSIIKLVYMF